MRHSITATSRVGLAVLLLSPVATLDAQLLSGTSPPPLAPPSAPTVRAPSPPPAPTVNVPPAPTVNVAPNVQTGTSSPAARTQPPPHHGHGPYYCRHHHTWHHTWHHGPTTVRTEYHWPREHPRPGQVRSAARRHFEYAQDRDGLVEVHLPGERPRELEDPTVRERVLLVEGSELPALARAAGEHLIEGGAPDRIGFPTGPVYIARTQFRDQDTGETVVLDSWFVENTGLLEHTHDALRRSGHELHFRYAPHVDEVRRLRDI